MSTRQEATIALERWSVHYGRPDGASQLVLDEWHRALAPFDGRILTAALDRVVREHEDSRWRPRLGHVAAACRRLAAEERDRFRPPTDVRGQPGGDFCRQCGTPFDERVIVRADLSSYERLLCECQYRATLRSRELAALEVMRQDGDAPFVADELRRRATVSTAGAA